MNLEQAIEDELEKFIAEHIFFFSKWDILSTY